MILTWDDIKHFKPHEFDSPDEKGSGLKFMNLEFVADLDFIRDEIGRPLSVNSGCRTPYWNKLKGGAKDSAHLTTRPCGVVAVDFHCTDSQLRRDIILVAESIGLNRIGLGNSFIHIDCDLTKHENVYWNYAPKRTGFSAKIFGQGLIGEDR